VTFSIRITEPAEADISHAYHWWRNHRSREQADRWYDGIYPAIGTLRDMPRGCALAHDQDACEVELRQLLFGIGRRATHRILFTIEDDTVVILRVLHHAQQDRTSDNFDR